ncbi:hypothetical protein FRC04_004295 [Tulasnella sp. 424]|nr:hypothetical protein FRC04_004295 [Tulasnella sp. 424]KAG8979418.1 hypothetical protein FRC05_008403 [Tulasnella sp. 425]
MPLIPHSRLLPVELRALVVEHLNARRDLAALIQSHSSFKQMGEKRLYHYIDVSDDDPARSIMCLLVVINRPEDVARYVKTVLVEMYDDFERWPPMKQLFTKALTMMPNVGRVVMQAYRGSETPLIGCNIDRLEAYSGRALLTAQQLDQLSQNGPGLIKLNIGMSPLLPDRRLICLDLDPRHRETLRHLRINLAYSEDEDVIKIVAKIAQLYPYLRAFHILRVPFQENDDKAQLVKALASFKHLVWFSFTSLDKSPLEDDREYVVRIHRACPTVREITLTYAHGPWRYSKKENRWLLRVELSDPLGRSDTLPSNPVWDDALVEDPLDYDYTYLSPLPFEEWRKRHGSGQRPAQPSAKPKSPSPQAKEKSFPPEHTSCEHYPLRDRWGIESTALETADTPVITLNPRVIRPPLDVA